ncbi:hypothetical protein D3C84_922660 [compost metagenome]
MPSEFALDLCFIREHTETPFYTMIDNQISALFAGKGNWYIDLREDKGLDIAVVEVKGMGAWVNEDEILSYIEERAQFAPTSDSSCWTHLHGYQVMVSPKVDAGCCRLKKEVMV